MSRYDVIIIGAGSVGVPTAMALGSAGVRTLVIDQHPSPGQGENKHAIGGIRATHASPGKILTGNRSLEIFATWEKQFRDDIEWLKGGYLFPAYTPNEETFLKEMLPIQKSHGLNIRFIGPKEVQSIVPGISSSGLIGGSFSPDDGSASPLLAINAFYRQALSKSVTFRFKTVVEKLCIQNQKITGVSFFPDNR